MQALDLLVVIDPYPSATAAMAAMPPSEQAQKILSDAGKKANPNRAVYLLPACTQFETSGSVTASGRSVQWRERVITPMFESQTDHAIMYAFAKKFGFDKELMKNFQIVETGRRRQMGRAHAGIDPEGDQRAQLDDRLHGAISGAPQASHEEPGNLRREVAPREGRSLRRRLLRVAVAVLRHARTEASGIAEPLPDDRAT